MIRAFQQLRDEARMQSMPGAIGNQPAEHGLSDQSKIAKKV